MINLDYPHLLDLFRKHLDAKRSQSASFLIWYFENYYRLDSEKAVYSVCDQSGDKGVDGILVDDDSETITVFQAKISQTGDSSIGDKPLREFVGTLTQFRDAGSVTALIDAAGNNLLTALIDRFDVKSKVDKYTVRGEFLANIDMDDNGKNFVNASLNLEFVGKTRLQATYISDARTIPVQPKATFDILGFTATEYAVSTSTKALIAPIKAKELVKMSGISDQSLFAYNLRGPLGATGVNKEIVKSIKNAGRHNLFPLFHNGITIIAKALERTKDEISVLDYFVVNGCQSLSALFNHQADLTDDLRILAKFVQVEPTSDLAALITEISNNQNGVKPRDFRSNHSFQIRLQTEFQQNYGDQYFFEIKSGEIKGKGEIIENEEAGLMLLAFDVCEPWATHRKYQVFEDKYIELFEGKGADRIVLCRVIMDSIDAALPRLSNGLVAKYVLTRYMLLYFVREILKKDELWAEINTHPQAFVGSPHDRQHFRMCVDQIVSDLIIDVDAEIKGAGDDFDYRGKLRNAEWVKELAKSVVGDHLKLVARKKIASFRDDWQAKPAPTVQP